MNHKNQKSLAEIYNKHDRDENNRHKQMIKGLQEKGLYPRKFMMPIALQLELTAKCNVECLHCYNDSYGSRSDDAMTADKWKDFCRYIVSKGGVFECVISGGEPLLLGDSLFDIMDILHDDGTFFLLITNGYLLDKDKVKRLKKYSYKWLQVSIDGVDAEYHDYFRQRKGSWEKAVQGAFMVSSAGISLTIAHSVSPQNLSRIDDMCKLAYEVGAGSIIISEIMPSGRTFKHEDLLLSDEQREFMYEKVEENTKRYKGLMLIQRSFDIRIQHEKHIGIPLHGLIVRPNGDMRLDCMLPFTVGNILDDDFYTIWNNKTDKFWEKEIVKNYMDSHGGDTIKNYVDPDVYLG